ncbi:MAG: SlyX family protein [Mariprofundaceae bacterium]
MDLEKHIIELETKVSYQDHIIQELNDVVTSQQKQIDVLESEFKRLREHLKTSSSSQLARPDEEVPPPHY